MKMRFIAKADTSAIVTKKGLGLLGFGVSMELEAIGDDPLDPYAIGQGT